MLAMKFLGSLEHEERICEKAAEFMERSSTGLPSLPVV